MRMTRTTALLAAAGLALASRAAADEWDVGADTDNAFTTDNAPLHGAEQQHDLGALTGGVADQDWFLVPNQPFSSYEFVVDGMTGDLDLGESSVQRLVLNGTKIVGSALVDELGGVLRLDWLGPTTGAPQQNWVRVANAACGTSCHFSQRYRARFRETTYTVPRFNNSGTQATVLVAANTTDRICDAAFYFLDANGGLIVESASVKLVPRDVAVLSTLGIAPNASGSVRVVHTCGYGGLAGKAVAVEPATGFTFDTAMVPRID
jgi:hypothetical protein